MHCAKDSEAFYNTGDVKPREYHYGPMKPRDRSSAVGNV